MPIAAASKRHHERRPRPQPRAVLADHRGKPAAVLGITLTVLVVEVVGAVLSGSSALLADAAHMLTDVAGPPSADRCRPGAPTRHPARTWGYHRAEVPVPLPRPLSCWPSAPSS